ncbi:EpsG family protein [Photobacterium atrarenae]|uniref:EpsG family protein n=1 Tax=Photobacterium atrarenae TaxID=865757 RepID=A0ABY5GCM1_9GAMM|nr:EpsG family protein [Photobacterium atrarenae]UTV26974.1 EpsG family protein [Photobacterium atrarenae]
MIEFFSLLISPLIVTKIYLLSGLHLIKQLRVLSVVLCTLLVVYLSLVLPERNLLLQTSGLGTDILHYFDAFNEILSLKSSSHSEIMKIAAENTGSWEPIFWEVVNWLSVPLNSSYEIWSGLIVLSLFLYIAAVWRISPEFILVSLCLYVSTITFFVFSISALRQFLALSFFVIALSVIKKDIVFYSMLLLAVLCHGTMLIVSPIIILAKLLSKRTDINYNKVIGVASVLSFSFLLFIKFILPIFLSRFSYIDYGVIGKLNAIINTKGSNSLSSLIQLVIEALIFSLYLYYYRSYIPHFLKLSFIFLFFISSALLIGTDFGDRVYRVIYIIYILSFAYHFSAMKSYLERYIFSIVIVSFSFVWFLIIYYTRYGVFYFDGVITKFFIF